LFGVPVSIKDLTDTEGVRTTYGAVRHADNVPVRDGVNAGRLRAAGLILIGKTTTPEFGMLGTTESELTGITNNPWNPLYTAGGSSGGAAASTAAGVTAVSWGSDGGGSIRVPASCCNLVGLKASRGRIPVDWAWESAAIEGPLSRTVIDAAAMLQATAGPSRRDPLSLPATTTDFLAAVREPRALKGMRIAFAPNPSGLVVAREVATVVADAVARLEAAGAAVDLIDLALPEPVGQCLAFWGDWFASAEDELGDLPHPAMRDLMHRLPPIEERLSARTTVRAQISNTYAQVFDRFDFIVTPTMPVAPFLHPGDPGGVTEIDGIPVTVPSLNFFGLTDPPTQAGLPAITVPAGMSSAGLPIGMQIIGDLFDDSGVLSLAAHCEQIQGHALRRPPL
jgi:Asp-tRNA(Asn)/Glu-tRNA(Gln) amidotransferase A subunit family amidase